MADAGSVLHTGDAAPIARVAPAALRLRLSSARPALDPATGAVPMPGHVLARDPDKLHCKRTYLDGY